MRTSALCLIISMACLTSSVNVAPALAYPAGQNLSIEVSARSVSRAGERLTVSAKNAQPGCRVNFSWIGLATSGTPSAIADSSGSTPQVSIATPPIAAKYVLRASLVSCAHYSGAWQSTVGITVGRQTKILCYDTASNYSALTSPVLHHDCYLKWGSQPIRFHSLRVRLVDPTNRQLAWRTFMTDGSGAIHATYVNKVKFRGRYTFETYFVPEKTYIANELTTSLVISK